MQYLLIALVTLVILVVSADIFVTQASSLARKLKINEFIIGFTILALGTSLPELIVSTYSTYIGHPEITISTVIGSNITNLSLILGIGALIKSYKLYKKDVDFNIPLNLLSVIAFISLLVFFSYKLAFFAGLIMLPILLFFIVTTKNGNTVIHHEKKLNYNFPLLVGSLIFLVISGKICVDNLISYAEFIKISESILGFFIIALGTSLPELVTLIVIIKRGNTEMGIGSLLGSNVINIFLTLGISSFITKLDFQKFIPEIGLLLFTTVMVVVLSRIGKKYYFQKLEGLLLVGIYVIFIIFQITK